MASFTYSKTSTKDKTILTLQIFPQESLSLWTETRDIWYLGFKFYDFLNKYFVASNVLKVLKE
jgi:hypothetical protein